MSIPFYNVQGIEFKANRLVLKIDSKQFIFNLSEISEKLANASTIEKERFEISPSGYGIHWPLIDEDLSIPGLLKIEAGALKIPGKINYAAV